MKIIKNFENMLNKPVYLDYTEIPFHDSVGLFHYTDPCGWSEGNGCSQLVAMARIPGFLLF